MLTNQKYRQVFLILYIIISGTACNVSFDNKVDSQRSLSGISSDNLSEFVNQVYHYKFRYPTSMQVKGLNIDEDPMNASSVALYLEPLKSFSSLLIEVSNIGKNKSFDEFCVDSFQQNKENMMENSVLLYGSINEEETCYFDVVNKYKTPTSISLTENPARLVFAMRGNHIYVFIFPLIKTTVINEILLKFEWIDL